MTGDVFQADRSGVRVQLDVLEVTALLGAVRSALPDEVAAGHVGWFEQQVGLAATGRLLLDGVGVDRWAGLLERTGDVLALRLSAALPHAAMADAAALAVSGPLCGPARALLFVRSLEEGLASLPVRSR